MEHVPSLVRSYSGTKCEHESGEGQATMCRSHHKHYAQLSIN